MFFSVSEEGGQKTESCALADQVLEVLGTYSSLFYLINHVISYFVLCMYSFVCAYMCMCTYCVHACGDQRSVDVGCIPWSFSTLLFETVFPLPEQVTLSFGKTSWLVSHWICLSLPSQLWASGCMLPFSALACGLGIQTQVHVFVQQAVYQLRHILSPLFTFSIYRDFPYRRKPSGP